MSRALRKMRNDKELPLEVHDSSEDEIFRVSQPKINPFKAVQPSSSSDSQGEPKESEENLDLPKKKKSKKNRTKRAKKAIDYLGQPGPSCSGIRFGDFTPSELTGDEEIFKRHPSKINGKSQKKKSCSITDGAVDEVDRCLLEVEKILSKLPIASPSHEEKPKPVRPLLYIENKHLNPANELYNMTKDKNKRKPNAKKVKSRYLKSRLVTPKNDWPFYGKPTGLNMRLVKTEDDRVYFAYEHGPFYQDVQYTFLDLIDTAQSYDIFPYLNEYPYHVDSLIQCANMSRPRNDPDLELDLISQALYFLESAAHSSFNFAMGNCRLLYFHQENRSFHIALAKQMCLVALKNCNRTALELCKLSLSLDKSDPLAMILIIDKFALLSKEYKWLVDMFKHWDGTRNLSLLPNTSYSMALACYKLAKEGDGDLTEAEMWLKTALRNFPHILIPLVEQDKKFKLCEEVREHIYFREDRGQYINPALTQLGEAYIRRCKGVWSEPALCEWAEAAAIRMITDGLQMDHLTKMKKLFTGVPPLAIDRHFVIFRDVMAPNGEEDGDFKSFWDPFPPPVGKVKYRLKPLHPLQVLPYHSVTLAFIQSLSPSYVIVDDDEN